jgi:hypothetical protein
MASAPHAYVVWSPQNRDDYARLSDRIAREGEWKDGRQYRYFVIGPFKYWEMNPVINRARGF